MGHFSQIRWRTWHATGIHFSILTTIQLQPLTPTKLYKTPSSKHQSQKETVTIKIHQVFFWSRSFKSHIHSSRQRCECFEIGCEWRWSSPIFHTSWWHRHGWCSLFGLGADDDIGEDLSWLFGLSAERRCHQGQQIGEWHLWSRWMFKFGIGTWYLGLQHRKWWDEHWRFVCCLDVDDDFVRTSKPGISGTFGRCTHIYTK